MGVLNVTPDSFSDGGRYLDPADAITRGLTLVEEGAISLLQTVDELLPEAKGRWPAPPTLKQLATHTSGLPAWLPLYEIGLGQDDA